MRYRNFKNNKGKKPISTSIGQETRGKQCVSRKGERERERERSSRTDE